MPNYNICIMEGHIVRDLEVIHTQNDNTVAKSAIAINYKRKNADDEVCFMDFEVWNKQAETMVQYVKKGDAILLQGRIKQDKWQAEDGTNRSRHLMVVSTFVFQGSKQQKKEEEDKPASDKPDVPF